MRTFIILISLIAILSSAARADYVAGVSGVCDSEQITLTIGATHIDFENGEDEVGILIHRSTLGTCNSEEMLNPDQLLPLPADGESIEHTFTDAVLPGVGYRYWLTLQLADGSQAWPAGNGPNLEVVGCGDWAVTRGILGLGDGVYPSLEPCECWYPANILEVEAGLDWLPYVGQMVEIRGSAWIDEMPGAADVMVTDIRLIEGCQAPVAAMPASWSAIKDLYR